MTEAKRRQRVARQVHEAASAARTTIVQRVFTESLNNVWADLFMRLAPSEEFIPAFGIPSATKTTLEVSLETRLRTGEPGGPPQMTLSAGNLNTAALSLFIALHLAVEPTVRCLVFDDPVQAMDEVHVAQFAALILHWPNNSQRQVVIAVHERELFDYLALELSPAYPGDTLITVELGSAPTIRTAASAAVHTSRTRPSLAEHRYLAPLTGAEQRDQVLVGEVYTVVSGDIAVRDACGRHRGNMGAADFAGGLSAQVSD